MTTFLVPDKFKEPLIAAALRVKSSDFLPGAKGIFHSMIVVDKFGRVFDFLDFVPVSRPIVLNPKVARSFFHRLMVWYTIRLVVEGRLPYQATTRFRFPRSGTVSSLNASISSGRENMIRRLRLSLRSKDKRVKFASTSLDTSRKNPETHFISLPTFSWSSFGGTTRDALQTVQDYNRTWSGVRTPNFGKLKASHQTLPINNHSVDIWKANISPYVRYDTEDVWQFNPSPYSTATIDPMTSRYNFPAAPSAISRAQDTALRRLYDKSDATLGGNLAQDFAQFGQMVNLFDGTIKRLTGALNDLRRGNIPGAVKSLWSHQNPRFRKHGGPSKTKDLANNWLELQYGWKPLLQDCHDAAEALAAANYANDRVLRVTGSGTAEDKVEYDVPLFEYGTVVGGRGFTTTTSRFAYGVRYVIDSHLLVFLAQTGFTNSLNLEWEILPFSFVVDWFIPIGNFLQTTSAWDGLRFVDGYTTSFTRQRATVAVSYSGQPVPSDPHYTFNAHGSMTREWVKLSRSRLSVFPGARFPQPKNPLSGLHIGNALALLRQTFGKT